jgi:GNAT superfamily N-acetyltransferase
VDELEIHLLRPDMVRDAVAVLAHAFVTNPLHVAAFGHGQLAKNETFFRIGLSVMRGPKHVAMDGSRLVGLIHWVDSPACHYRWHEKLRLAPAMSRGFGVGASWRLGSWLATWAALEPKEPHCHLGPVGVSPDAQRRRIGHRLMERYCEGIDRRSMAGYLETDRPENVEFYRRFGFMMHEEADVLGVRNYFMWREARG